MILNNILMIIFLSNPIIGVNYCSNQLKCQGVTNSGCQCSFASSCKKPKVHATTAEVKHAVTDGHNKLREKVANGMENRGGLSGTAELMYALKWDNQLEYVATCWNKQCQFDHDKCRSTEEFPKVGQNLYWSSGQACDWKRDLDAALQGWYDEVKDMSDQCLHQFGVGCDTMKVGHFTQLAWGSTARVGCSLVEYDGQCQIACNYGPSGNFQGQPMYVRGPATCEFDSVKYKNLCLLRADDESGAKRIKGIYKNLYLIIYLIIVIGIYY